MAANVHASPPPADVGGFFKLLADDTRRTIVRLLAFTDMRVGELTERLRAPQNAVSYHLRLLRELGLLRDRRGGYDARDVYYSVDLDRLQALYAAAGSSLHRGLVPGAHGRVEEESGGEEGAEPLRILFLCTHNSARSQMAEEGAREHEGPGRGTREHAPPTTRPVYASPSPASFAGGPNVGANTRFAPAPVLAPTSPRDRG